MSTERQEDALARELIALVEIRTAPQAVILQHRIDQVMVYMDAVTAPNRHTLNHIRRYLDGTYDTHPTLSGQAPTQLTRSADNLIIHEEPT